MGSESDVATDWKTHLIIGKNFSYIYGGSCTLGWDPNSNLTKN